ncbi:MAG: DUF1858 domain-containing protein [Erysipelothrix sp.]|jgi:hypothetical protein|nr:DUF1858 domain-containing protein [Erysipelothrix sp.]
MIYIDVQQSVYDIINAYPGFKAVMIEAGFTKLVDSNMLNTMGKIMTLEKGLMLRGIDIVDLERISNTFNFTLYKNI